MRMFAVARMALAFAIALGASTLPRDASAQKKVYGVVMPPDAVQIGQDRYRTSQNISRTRRYFARTVGSGRGLIWRPIRGNPDVQGVHILNNRSGRTWDGINIYQHRGKVFIYVVKAEETAQKKR